ncbi:TolC family protein [Stenotrophomonas sp. 24(2023)]|uniref:TolC family protein n=1 Tax=Stenotrophomonas sp. 24(2023) TaxID=3068324 RepID=UPI0027DFC030|nr:TolC family protein [Stenotrophomonas sp. 24(2023)]WMJ69176.1 TolC family protein [Stenotrophomonas sp. 24(2023)]
MFCPFRLRHRRSVGGCAALLLAACFAIPVAWSAPTTITFTHAQTLALQAAPSLQARQAQVLAAGEESHRAAALPDPQLSVGIVNLPITGREALNAGADDMTMKEIAFTQAFPARAKRLARQEVADRQVEQAHALSVAEQAAVRQAVASAWIARWAAQREVDALRMMREPAEVAVRTAKARLAGGTGSATDALATRADALELENRIDAAEAGATAAQAGLARWLDLPAEAFEIAGDPPDLATLPHDRSALLGNLDQQAPLLPWQSREAMAEAEVSAALAETRPDWSVSLGYGQRSRTPDGLPRSDMLTLQVAVGLPLFTRNRQDRGIAARRADLQAVSAEHEDARRAQAAQVQQWLAAWDGANRAVARKQSQLLPLAADRSRTALAAYAGGGELQPWLQARRDEIELHIEHARHLGELGRDWAALAYLLPTGETQP